MQWTGVCQCVCLFHRLDCAAATAGLLLSAVQAGRTRRSTWQAPASSINGAVAWSSAANAGSATMTAEVRGLARPYYYHLTTTIHGPSALDGNPS